MRLSPALSGRLAHARDELKRLSDWARWGGNVSREELIKAVEHLGTQNLAMGELAKKVGSMRDRWKSLDTLSGSAPKSLWERFDAACSATYAPAAAHFKHLADERHTNAAKAEALIADAAAEPAPLTRREPGDWTPPAARVQGRQKGYHGEVRDLPSLDPKASTRPAAVRLQEEMALTQRFPRQEQCGDEKATP